MSHLVLNIILYTLIALGLTLPLVFLLIRGRIAQQRTQLAQAWRETITKEAGKADVLGEIEEQLRSLIERELKLLEDVTVLQREIADLPTDNPDPTRLAQVEQRTQQAIAGLAAVMEAQVESEGGARLRSKADRLAEKHADNDRALRRLQDVAAHVASAREAQSFSGRVRRKFYEEAPAPQFPNGT